MKTSAAAEATKGSMVPAAQGLVLAFTFAESTHAALQLIQILLGISMLALGWLQVVRFRRRMVRERILAGILEEARTKCRIARAGDCPMQNRMEEIERLT